LISQGSQESVSETERVKDLDIDHIDRIRISERAFRRRAPQGARRIHQQNGVLQPIVVRRVENRYESFRERVSARRSSPAGRRFRRSCGTWTTRNRCGTLSGESPARDLNPIEEARGYQALKTATRSRRDIAGMIARTEHRREQPEAARAPEIVKALIVEGSSPRARPGSARIEGKRRRSNGEEDRGREPHRARDRALRAGQGASRKRRGIRRTSRTFRRLKMRSRPTRTRRR